jgi:hypothetical protein
MIVKVILTYGGRRTFLCDNKCNKAWGISNCPKIRLSDINEDDYVYLADDELGEAPVCPGTWEGGEGKPIREDQKPNKWCVRECERSSVFERAPKDHSKRSYNRYVLQDLQFCETYGNNQEQIANLTGLSQEQIVEILKTLKGHFPVLEREVEGKQ